MAAWPIWFSEVPSGDLHVRLWDFLHGKSVCLITSPFDAQNISPFSLTTSHTCFSFPTVWAYLCINEADNHDKVSCLSFDVEGSMKLVVIVFLHFFLSLVGCCIDLNDCGVLALKSSWENSLKHWFPFLFYSFLTSSDKINFVWHITFFRVVHHHLPDQNRVLSLQLSNGPSRLITVHLVSLTPRKACFSILISLAAWYRVAICSNFMTLTMSICFQVSLCFFINYENMFLSVLFHGLIYRCLRKWPTSWQSNWHIARAIVPNRKCSWWGRSYNCTCKW